MGADREDKTTTHTDDDDSNDESSESDSETLEMSKDGGRRPRNDDRNRTADNRAEYRGWDGYSYPSKEEMDAWYRQRDREFTHKQETIRAVAAVFLVVGLLVLFAFEIALNSPVTTTMITVIIGLILVLFGIDDAHWFLSRGGASPPTPKPMYGPSPDPAHYGER